VRIYKTAVKHIKDIQVLTTYLEVRTNHNDIMLFFHVPMYGDSFVGHINRSNSLDQSVDLRPTGSIILFHNAFAAEIQPC